VLEFGAVLPFCCAATLRSDTIPVSTPSISIFLHFQIFVFHFLQLNFEFRGKSESSGFERLGFISLFVIAIVCGVAQIIIAGITLNDIKILQDCIQQHSCPCNAVLGGFFCKYLSSHVQISSLTRFT
jgi:hypothetical protein